MRIRLAAVFVSMLAILVCAGVLVSRMFDTVANADDVEKVSIGDLVDIPVLEPDDDPQGLVILISGKNGQGRTEQALTQQLLARNMVVLPVNLETWRKKLDADDGDCLYLGSDLEDIGKEALRTIDDATFFHPVIVGVGEGGTLAWAALADAPVATFAGAVALDPTPTLDTRLPTCPGATSITKMGSGYAYGTNVMVPGRAVLISAKALPPSAPATGSDIEPIAASDGHEPSIIVDADADNRFNQAVDAVVTVAKADAKSQALPVVDIPTPKDKPPIAVAVFYSGDGGWRDIDKSMGDWLANNGVHVVGVDSLRYFWAERTPDEIAADTTAMVSRADPTGKLPVAVLGYSFGADTFPFAWDKLAKPLQDRIHLVGLLAPSRTTTFQVSVGEWLGIGDDHDVVKAIETVPSQKVVCAYGVEDDETACTAPSLSKVEILQTEGGHHFDENYETLAEKLLDALKKRLTVGT